MSTQTDPVAGLPYWAETLRALHWGKGVIDNYNSVPFQDSDNGIGSILKIVTKTELSVPLQKATSDPLIIRPIYQEIEHKLLYKLPECRMYRGGIRILGGSGVGQFFVRVTAEFIREEYLPMVLAYRHDAPKTRSVMGT
jgi:hypothetical protein